VHHEIKKEQACTKSKCSKQKASQTQKAPYNERKNCPAEGCNPFVPCSIGSCCYLVENFFSQKANPIIKKQKLPLLDDNTILNVASECWHPPEMIS